MAAPIDTPRLSKDKSIHVTDEVYNTVISGFGAFLSVIGCAFLLYRAQAYGETVVTISFLIYSIGLVNMFLSSALHHGVNGSEKVNHALRQFDYFAIFIMIAGTFTPFCLILLDTLLSKWVLGIVWTIAIGGIALKALFPHAPKWLTLSLYLGMGWLSVLVAKPIFFALSWQGVTALVTGGLLFTVGGFIYGLERPNPFPGKFGFHEIWHCFVLAGAGSHFYVMYNAI